MKKRVALILSVLLALGMLAGCGKEEGNLLQDIKVSKYISFNAPYTGLDLTIAPKVEVTDEEVEMLAINAYNSALTAETGITDRAVALGDTVNIDYAGKVDGVAFEGGTAAGQSLEIGSGYFIDGFETGLIGVMPGETVDLNLQFPREDYPEELKGKDVVFTVTVNFIYLQSTEEMADETINSMTGGEFSTVADFMAYTREYLEFNADYQYNIGKENAVINALEAIRVCEEVPEQLKTRYAENVRTSLTEQAAQAGVDVETFCTYYYQTDAETYIASMAEDSASQAMMFQYIANKEKLNVSDEELDTLLQEFAEENKVETVEELLEQTDKEEFREYFMFEKVVDFIVENANVNEG